MMMVPYIYYCRAVKKKTDANMYPRNAQHKNKIDAEKEIKTNELHKYQTKVYWIFVSSLFVVVVFNLRPAP